MTLKTRNIKAYSGLPTLPTFFLYINIKIRINKARATRYALRALYYMEYIERMLKM